MWNGTLFRLQKRTLLRLHNLQNGTAFRSTKQAN